jgi:hypothetical protein
VGAVGAFILDAVDAVGSDAFFLKLVEPDSGAGNEEYRPLNPPVDVVSVFELSGSFPDFEGGSAPYKENDMITKNK